MTLIYLAGSWLLGLYLGSRWDVPGSLLGAAAAMLVGLAFVLRRRLRITLYGVMAAALLSGWLRYDLERHRLSPDPVSAYNGRSTLILRGMVVNDPAARDRWTNLDVQVDSVEWSDQWTSTSGLVQVQVPSYDEHEYGEVLEITGRLQSPPDYLDLDFRQYLARRGIHSILRYGDIRVLSRHQGHPLWSLLFALKGRTRTNLWRLLPEPQASLLTGILLGSDEGIPQTLVDDMRTTGTAHIIAISGFNIAVVSAAVAGLLSRLCRRYVALALTFAIILLYAILVGAEAPVMRATIMGILGAIAIVLGRRAHGFTSLAAAAWFLTLWDPFVLWDASFQLSFLATWGLVGFSDRFQAGAAELIVPARWGPDISSWVQGILAPLTLTLAAQLTVLPWMLRVFGQASLLSLLVNLLVLPIQPLVVYLGGMAALCSHLSMSAARVLGYLAWVPVTFTIRVVQGWAPLAARLSWTPQIPSAIVLAYYALLAAVTWRWMARPLRTVSNAVLPGTSFSRTAGMGMLVVMVLVIWNGERLPSPSLRVTFLDVGQGDAVLVQTPSGRVALIDGGPSPVVLQAALGRHLALWERTLDVVVLTHSHDDHIRGLLGLQDRLDVRQVLTGKSTRPNGALQHLHSSGLPVLATSEPWSVEIDTGIQLMVWPCSGQGVSDELGLVARLSCGQTSFFLTGDAEAVDLEGLGRAGWPMQSTVVKVAHHGSDEALSAGLLDSVQPALAVVSVGADNGFGHPAESTMLALLGRNIPVLRTDEYGDIEILVRDDQLRVKTQRTPAR